MNPFRLFFIILKEYIKKPLVWIIVIFIPIVVLTINVNESAINSHSIRVAYYLEDNSESLDKIEDAFKKYQGVYDFIRYNDLNEMIIDVSNFKLECAYAFPKDFFERMQSKGKNESIELYISSSTTMNSIINETVYSLIFPIISEEKLFNYIIKDSEIADCYADKLFSENDVAKLYDKYLNNGSTFHFNYEGECKSYKLETDKILLNPLKGLIGLMILLSAYAGAYSLYKESMSLLKNNKAVRLCYISIPALFALVSSIISILISKGKVSSNSIIINILILVLYTIICIVFSFVTSLLIKNEIIFASIIPVTIIATILFTPIIVDFSIFIAAIKYFSHFILPYYLIIFL